MNAKSARVLSWVLLGLGLVMIIGGFVFDMTHDGKDEVNLTGLYAAGAVLCALAAGVFGGFGKRNRA